MSIDPNLIYIIAASSLGAWALGKRVYKSFQAAADSAPPGASFPLAPVQTDGTPQALPLAQVITYLNDRADDAPHCFIVGSTGAGKSTFAKLLLAPRVQRGESFVILTGKRSQAFAGVPCIGRDGVGDYTSVDQMCSALLDELIARDRVPLDQRRFTPLSIVLDDATVLLAASDTAQACFREVALIGREVQMRLIIILGSIRVKELGLEGRGDLREHFAVVQYHKRLDGSRVTTVRPRFDDGDDVPFDATPVPRYADKVPIDARQVWQPQPSADDVLHGLLLPSDSADRQTDRQTDGAHTPKTAPHRQTDRPPITTKEDVIKLLVQDGWNNAQIRDVVRGDNGKVGELANAYRNARGDL